MTKPHTHEPCPHCGGPTATCETCGNVFWVPWGNSGRYCSKECYWIGKRGQKKVERPKYAHQQHLVRRPEHPLAPPSGYLAQARVILFEQIGLGPHPCHWCGEPVDWVIGGGPASPGALLADHLNWDRADDRPENLVPACNSCNAHRRSDGKRNRIQPGEATVLRGGKPTRAVWRDCQRCQTPFLITPAEIAHGGGKYCSRECLWKRHQPVP